MTNLTHYYLRQMGIDVWQLRTQTQPVAALAVDFEKFSLLDNNQQLLGEVWLERWQASAEVSEKVYRLLDAMMMAIGLRRVAKTNETAVKFRLVMGHSLAQNEFRQRSDFHSEQGELILVTYHPLVLLTAPQQKKEAWQDLQKLCKTIDITIYKRKDAPLS